MKKTDGIFFPLRTFAGERPDRNKIFSTKKSKKNLKKKSPDRPFRSGRSPAKVRKGKKIPSYFPQKKYLEKKIKKY